MKFTRKLIPALAMLVVSATLTSTASYAWFSMNRTVTATGMQATAVSPVNLLIKQNGVEGNFGTSATVATPNPGIVLSPMSTVNPADTTTFYAIEDGVINDGAGGSVAANGAGTFVKATDATGTFYVDYTFDLKLSSNVANKTIYAYLSELTITNVSADIKGAVRVAVIVDGASKGIYGTEAADSATGTAASAIKTVDTNKKCTEVQEVATISGTVNENTATYAYAAANAFVVTAEAETVTVRVWIEGQDDDCINANAGVTFNVSLAFGVQEVANNA